jgi:cell fate regulator YaaT (PSP1 superfamily)
MRRKKVVYKADGGRRDGQDIIETMATTQKAVAEGRTERVRDKRQETRDKREERSSK